MDRRVAALDEEALSTARFPWCMRGDFPDGMVFHMPELDALPASRNIADLFPPTLSTVTVLLAVTARKQDGLNCDVNGAPNGIRYISETKV